MAVRHQHRTGVQGTIEIIVQGCGDERAEVLVSLGLEMDESDKRLDRRWCLADAMYCSEQALGNPTDLCRRLFLHETGVRTLTRVAKVRRIR